MQQEPIKGKAMAEHSPIAVALRDGLIVVVAAMGLQMEPSAFVGCGLLAVAGAVVGRGFSPEMATRRAYGLTLGGGLLIALLLLLADQALSKSYESWPDLPPQLLALVAGVVGPILLPVLLRRFPTLADRVIGKYLPEEKLPK